MQGYGYYSRQSQTLAACAILAGLASTPPVMTTSAGIAQQGRAEYTQFWHQSMWSASLAEEFKVARGDVAYGKTVMASYEGCLPQVVDFGASPRSPIKAFSCLNRRPAREGAECSWSVRVPSLFFNVAIVVGRTSLAIFSGYAG